MHISVTKKMAVHHDALYLCACGAQLALGAREAWEADGASLSLRTPNTSCSLNTL